MSKKYIIEIEDQPFANLGALSPLLEEKLYRVKGFKSLVFDQNGLDRLTPYKPDCDYQRGLCDVWDWLEKIETLKKDEIIMMYGTNYMPDILDKFPPEEAIKKLKAYEEQKDEIKVGDEVECKYGKRIVTAISNSGLEGFGKGGGICAIPSDAKRTGRHFPEIMKVIEAMREEE